MLFAADLETNGDRVAIVDHDGTELSYAQLARRADLVAEEMGRGRRLVLLAAENELDSVVAYLAALRAGNPLLVAPPAAFDDMVRQYDPDVVFGAETDWRAVPRRRGTVHDLHPELAMLLCTSGSTGSAKTVRLSHENVHANATAIAESLDLAADERAVTSLPMAYCYGLSVINSNLAAGARVVLSTESVVDPCFWERFQRHACTSLAAVPYTFELLDRVGFEHMELPSLRRVTQAGGRLDPGLVVRFAAMGRSRGWNFVVMYGQTEATARMACLDPERAESRPTAIGSPIPGGSIRIDAPDEDGRGEVVYTGPNVMMGYALGPDDLAAGRDVFELRTGDLARQADDGLYEIVGRASRFVKLFGLRIDLDRVEQDLRDLGIDASCAGDDSGLAIAVVGTDSEGVVRTVAERFGLPVGSVLVVEVDDLPRTTTGKPDYAGVTAAARKSPSVGRRRVANVDGLEKVFATVLGVEHLAETDTFVGLGGDSLSYVEVSLGVEEHLGFLPRGWHLMSIAELKGLEVRERSSSSMDTTVLLRALAMVMVVGTHVDVFETPGAAHVLLGAVGYNVARFQLVGAGSRARALFTTAGRVALPCAIFIGALSFWKDDITLANVALANNYLADGTWRYWYWFVEVLVQALVLIGVLLAIPAVTRAERRAPFGFAIGIVALTLALRLIPMGDPANQIYRTHSVLWLLALGWAAQRASAQWQRVTVSVLVAVSVPGFFDSPGRAFVVAGGLLVLIWFPHVPVWRAAVRPLAIVAASSLAIYLTHWPLLPVLAPWMPAWVALIVMLGLGVVGWWIVQQVTRWLRSGPLRAAAPVDAGWAAMVRSPAGPARRGGAVDPHVRSRSTAHRDPQLAATSRSSS